MTHEEAAAQRPDRVTAVVNLIVVLVATVFGLGALAIMYLGPRLLDRCTVIEVRI